MLPNEKISMVGQVIKNTPDSALIIFSRLTILVLSYFQLNFFLLSVGVEVYGIYSILISSVVFLSFLGGLGLNYSTSRKLATEESVYLKKEIIMVSIFFTIFSGFLVSSFLLLSSKVIATNIYNDIALTPLFSFASLVLIPSIFSINLISILQGLKKLKVISIVPMALKFVDLLISIFFTYIFKLEGMIFAYLLSS